MRTAPPKRDKPRTTKSQTRRARGLVGAAQHFWRQDHHLQELAPEYSAHLTDQSVEQVARGEDSLSTPQSRRDAGRRWRAAPDEGLSQRHLFAWPSPRPYPQAGRVTTPRSETSMELHRREFSALPEREYAYGRRRACRRRKSVTFTQALHDEPRERANPDREAVHETSRSVRRERQQGSPPCSLFCIHHTISFGCKLFSFCFKDSFILGKLFHGECPRTSISH
jgi:hypothetical protein